MNRKSLVILPLLLAACSFGPNAETTAQLFLQSLLKQDFKTAQTYADPALARELETREAMVHQLGQNPELKGQLETQAQTLARAELLIVEVKTTGDTAAVRWKTSASPVKTLQLKSTASGWKVSAFE